MGADTAMSVASEMVEDLSLSHDDARAIAAAIKQEIKQLTGQAPMFSAVDRSVLDILQVKGNCSIASKHHCHNYYRLPTVARSY